MRSIFELDSLDRLGLHLAPLGARRVLVVSSPKRRFVQRAVAAMPGLQTRVFDGARVHVPASAVKAALAAANEHQADTVVTIGGGAAVGLGKALCLERDLNLVCIATTYSGSEMTNIFGITKGGQKRTGRDDRVRPDLVLYDARLTTKLPVALTTQSLGNSLAQIISALSTDSLEHPEEILPTVGEIWQLMNLLGESPEDLALRQRALRASSRAGEVVDRGTMGAQHKLAHCIGGHFDLQHSTVHSVLLPCFMAWLRRRNPALMQSLDVAADQPLLEAALHDLLKSTGSTISLRELGVSADELEKILEGEPRLPKEIARDAFLGTRPLADARPA